MTTLSQRIRSLLGDSAAQDMINCAAINSMNLIAPDVQGIATSKSTRTEDDENSKDGTASADQHVNRGNHANHKVCPQRVAMISQKIRCLLEDIAGKNTISCDAVTSMNLDVPDIHQGNVAEDSKNGADPPIAEHVNSSSNIYHTIYPQHMTMISQRIRSVLGETNAGQTLMNWAAITSDNDDAPNIQGTCTEAAESSKKGAGPAKEHVDPNALFCQNPESVASTQQELTQQHELLLDLLVWLVESYIQSQLPVDGVQLSGVSRAREFHELFTDEQLANTTVRAINDLSYALAIIPTSQYHGVENGSTVCHAFAHTQEVTRAPEPDLRNGQNEGSSRLNVVAFSPPVTTSMCNYIPTVSTDDGNDQRLLREGGEEKQAKIPKSRTPARSVKRRAKKLPSDRKSLIRWAHLVEKNNSIFVSFEYYGMVADSVFFSMSCMKPCGLTSRDKVGKYRTQQVGFVGFCCKFCDGQVSFGRYFPGSFNSFLNGKTADGVVEHMASECQFCPPEIRKTVHEILGEEKTLPKKTAYGSRKRYFAFIWHALRDEKTFKLVNKESDTPNQNSIVRCKHGVVSEPNNLADNLNDIPWRSIFSGSKLVLPEDRGLVSDIIILALCQMIPCKLTAADRVGRCRSHKIGFVGLCCKYCGGKAGKPGYGRYFPRSIRTLSQIDSCRHMINHISSKCPSCPTEIRSLMLELQLMEDANRTRYGSRKLFFHRVWTRLHGNCKFGQKLPFPYLESSKDGLKLKHQSQPETFEDDFLAGSRKKGNSNPKKKSKSEHNDVITSDDIPWQSLVEGNKMVTMNDRRLVSGIQFAAIAQMEPCQVTQADKISSGWYKHRKVGFGGMQCRHCGGRPSAGRYFPNSLRSLAQTASNQTIVNHILSQCKSCPDEIRNALMKLHVIDQSSNPSSTSILNNGASYGSRRAFYNKIWSMIHQHNNLQSLDTQETPSNTTESSDNAAKDDHDVGVDQDMSEWDDDTSASYSSIHSDEIEDASCCSTASESDTQEQQRKRSLSSSVLGDELCSSEGKRPKLGK